MNVEKNKIRLISQALFPYHVPKILLVFAHHLDHVLVCKIVERQIHAPGLGIRIRVLDDELQVHVPEIPAAVALGDLRRLGLRMPVHIQPAAIIQARGFDHERVSVPVPHRVAHVRGLRDGRQRAPVQEDLAEVVIRLVQDRDHLRHLDDSARLTERGIVSWAMTDAALGGMALLQGCQALFVERGRRGQHGSLICVRGEVKKIIWVVGTRPDSGQIRLAIRCLWRGGGDVRFAVRRARNSGRGIVQPLRGERRADCDRRKDKALHHSDSLLLSPDSYFPTMCTKSFSFSQISSITSSSGTYTMGTFALQVLVYAAGSSMISSSSICPKSGRRNRSVMCVDSVCGCPSMSSQPSLLRPLVSTTSASPSHRPIE